MSIIHKIVERLRENNQPISSKKCPPEITLEMLTKEMKSIELDIMGDIGIDNLWYKYCQINYTTNIFGLYVTDENTEIDFKIIIENNNNALPSKANPASRFNTLFPKAKPSSRFNTLFSKAKPTSRFNPLFSRPKTSSRARSKTSSRARPKSSSSARSKTSRVKIQEGGLNAGLISTIDNTYEYMKPKWTWNKLVKIDTARLDGYLGINGAPPLLLYGTSLPLIIINPRDRNVNSNNVINTFYTLSFYMFMKDIKQLISLHTCLPRGSQRSCNGVVVNNINFGPPNNISPQDNTINDPYFVQHQPNAIPRIADGDYDSERRAWEGIKNSLELTANDNAITYTGCEITDMTCGSIDIWRQIDRFNFDVNKGIVHCAGGYGRTGSVLLYNILKRINTLYRGYPATNIGFNIEDEFLGFTDSGNMYGGIQTLIRTFIVTDDNPIENGVYNADIVDNTVAANSQHLAGHNNLVVLLDELTAPNILLVQRLNNIILRIARHLQIVNPVYLYDITLPRPHLFVPIRIRITHQTVFANNNQYGLQF
jgi:hypothetical protein